MTTNGVFAHGEGRHISSIKVNGSATSLCAGKGGCEVTVTYTTREGIPTTAWRTRYHSLQNAYPCQVDSGRPPPAPAGGRRTAAASFDRGTGARPRGRFSARRGQAAGH